MEFTPRIRQILQTLLTEESAISIKKLAEKTGISKRTVQRELESVNRLLRPFEVQFQSKTGVGVWLEGSEEAKEGLMQKLCTGDDYDVSDRESRRKRLILEILKEKGLKKLFYYSSQFAVSEATVSTDLEAVEGWLNQYGLTVIRKPGSGIEVEGSEESYRRAIRAFVRENIDTKLLREAYEDISDREDSSYEILKKSNMGDILNDDIMRRVADCITGMDNARVLTLTESSYTGLIIHISIAINRILKNEFIELNEKWMENIPEDEDYALAGEIVKELEQEFEIQIPEMEIAYIYLHIKGSKHERIQWDGREVRGRELHQLVNAMISAFDRESAYLLKQDDEFLQGLLAHLQPTLIRLVHGMQIQNPVLEDIKENYPVYYKKCENVAKVLEESTGKKVPEEETGFLAVHFGAAMIRLEGKKEKIRKVNVGVICSSGIGISRLMSSKLAKVFQDRMQITAYGKNDITPYIVGKTDFFISSISIEQQEVPVIFVNPLLNDEDMDKIRGMVYQYERTPEKHKEQDKFTLQLEEINLMAAQINTVIKDMNLYKVNPEITFEELLIAVGEKLSVYSDRREMIREDIMQRERMFSQVFAEFGFALLHTRTKGVVRPTFTVWMTKDLGTFRDPYFKGITVVFVMLVPVDENIRINNDILGYISTMLIEEYSFLDTIAGGDKEEIRAVLSKYLKQYFSKYVAGLS